MPLSKSDGPPPARHAVPLSVWLQGLQAHPWLIEASLKDPGVRQLLHEYNNGAAYSLAQLYCVVGKYVFERGQRLNSEITDLYLRTIPSMVVDPSKS